MKIKLERIDTMYIYHPDCLISIKNETKLRFSAKEYEEWIDEMTADKSHAWENPKFPSQCWFLTLHAHHLGIIPAIQRYAKRLRAIKELQRMVDELNSTKSQWESTPLASRHRKFKERWVAQIKKLTRAKQCCDIGLLDPTLMRQCMSFYSTVCEFLMFQMEGRKIDGPFLTTIQPTLLVSNAAFSALPEWYIEDLADFLLFCMQ